MAYKIYMSNSIYYYAEGKRMAKRFDQIISTEKTDNRTAEEIVADVIKKAELIMEDDG